MTLQLACQSSDVAEESALRVELSGETGTVAVAIVRDSDGDLHAISDECSHQAVSLSQGEVEGCLIECWLHGAQFDLRTGQPTSLPATKPISVYPLVIQGNDVLVDVDTTL